MNPMQRVLLCGSSLFISGLQASLEAAPGVELQRVEATPDRLQERLACWKPDVLILELEALQRNLSLAMLKEFPSLLLVGLDAESDRLLVLSGQPAMALTAEELMEVIRHNKPGSG